MLGTLLHPVGGEDSRAVRVKSQIYDIKSASQYVYSGDSMPRERTFKARVAFGPIALENADMKTTPAGRPSRILVGLEKTGPKPCARPTAQPKRAKPKMGMTTI